MTSRRWAFIYGSSNLLVNLLFGIYLMNYHAFQALESEAEDKNDLEHQVKGYLVANTRQNRAFAEIMRLIEWATTPPSSAGRSPAV